MKVIIDARLLSKGGISGIEEYTRSLISQLLKSGSDAYSIFYNGVRKIPLPAEWTENPRVSVADSRIPNRLFDLGARFFDYPPVELFAKGDAVLSPHFNILKTRLPHIVTFHDLSFIHHPDFFLWRQKFWHWLQDCAEEARRASRIIAVSEFTKSDLMEIFGVPEARIQVIYSGIHEAMRRISPEDSGLASVKKRHRLDRPFILYLGTIEPRKNVLSIVRAFNMLKEERRFRDFTLVIAGQPGWLYQETLKEARNSRFADDIRFLGKVESEERAALYNLASVFVYPSFFEGFGFPPLEAEACGLPVVASNRTSLPEILGSSAILIEPWRIDQMHAAISDILLSPAIRERYISLGLANAARFSWERAARETRAVYNEL